MKKKICLLLILCIAGFWGCTTKPDSKTQTKEKKSSKDNLEDLYSLIPSVSAAVNGVEIKRDRVKIALNAEITKLLMMGEIIKPDSRELVLSVVDDLISEELIYQQKNLLNVSIEEGELNKEFSQLKARFPSEDEFKAKIKEQNFDISTIKKEILRNMTIRKIIKEKTEIKLNVQDDQIQKYYDKNPKRFKQEAAVKASHILVKFEKGNKIQESKARKKIEDLLEKARIGADFSELAKEHSDGPSAKKGGDLGFFTRGKMIPAFEQTAFNLKIGELSEVVETPFGYHIIQVFDKKEGKMLSFNDVKKDIKAFLERKKSGEIINAWIDSLKKDAKIDNFLEDVLTKKIS